MAESQTTDAVERLAQEAFQAASERFERIFALQAENHELKTEIERLRDTLADILPLAAAHFLSAEERARIQAARDLTHER